MQVTLKMNSFDMNWDNIASFVDSYEDGKKLCDVTIDFTDKHTITVENCDESHYVQAKIIYEASMLLDDLFTETGDNAVMITFEA